MSFTIGTDCDDNWEYTCDTQYEFAVMLALLDIHHHPPEVMERLFARHRQQEQAEAYEVARLNPVEQPPVSQFKFTGGDTDV